MFSKFTLVLWFKGFSLAYSTKHKKMTNMLIGKNAFSALIALPVLIVVQTVVASKI